MIQQEKKNSQSESLLCNDNFSVPGDSFNYSHYASTVVAWRISKVHRTQELHSRYYYEGIRSGLLESDLIHADI